MRLAIFMMVARSCILIERAGKTLSHIFIFALIAAGIWVWSNTSPLVLMLVMVAPSTLAALALVSVNVPSGWQVKRRLEKESSLTHRPLSTLDDRRVGGDAALWERSMQEKNVAIGRLRIFPPRIKVGKIELLLVVFSCAFLITSIFLANENINPIKVVISKISSMPNKTIDGKLNAKQGSIDANNIENISKTREAILNEDNKDSRNKASHKDDNVKNSLTQKSAQKKDFNKSKPHKSAKKKSANRKVGESGDQKNLKHGAGKKIKSGSKNTKSGKSKDKKSAQGGGDKEKSSKTKKSNKRPDPKKKGLEPRSAAHSQLRKQVQSGAKPKGAPKYDPLGREVMPIKHMNNPNDKGAPDKEGDRRVQEISQEIKIELDNPSTPPANRAYYENLLLEK